MDKNVEYTLLKNEILNLDMKRNNLVITMYSLFVTVFCFAIEFHNKYMFLSIYIVLFAFQRQFINIREGINRIAAYIVVFIDNPNGWESLYADIFNATCLKKKQIVKENKVFQLFFGKHATVQLAMICSLSTVLMIVSDFYKDYRLEVLNSSSVSWFQTLKISDVLVILITVKLYVLLRGQAIEVIPLNQRQEYIQSLRKLRRNLDEEKYKKNDESTLKKKRRMQEKEYEEYYKNYRRR